MRVPGPQKGKPLSKERKKPDYVLPEKFAKKREFWSPKVKEMYQSEMSLDEIRKETGLTTRFITKLLTDAGVKMRPAGPTKGKPQPNRFRPTKLAPNPGWESEDPQAECNQEIKRLYESGSTFADLSLLTGLSQRQLTKRLLSNGVTIRPPGHMKGRPLPPEVAKKVSESKMGWVPPPMADEHRAKLQKARQGRKPSLGMKHSIETRRKMSETRKGEGNGRWIDGRKQTPYPPEWTKPLRKEIRTSQEYRCAICGQKNQRDMHVHHIDWDKQNCARGNLAGLCYKCHGVVHRSATAEEYKEQLRQYVQRRDAQI